MDEKIDEAIKLLNENGYLVLKLSKEQIKRVKTCDADGAPLWCDDCFNCINRNCLKSKIKEQMKC
jgi:hypothetical protein